MQTKKKIMTKEDRELLLIDLCARVPYGVKVFVDSDRICYVDEWSFDGEPQKIDCVSTYGVQLSCMDIEDGVIDFDFIKPYLRPLSSMTEEDLKSLFSTILNENNIEIEVFPANNLIAVKIKMGTVFFSSDTLLDEIGYIGYDWFNANHFYYRGLIHKNLAIDATGKGIY